MSWRAWDGFVIHPPRWRRGSLQNNGEGGKEMIRVWPERMSLRALFFLFVMLVASTASEVMERLALAGAPAATSAGGTSLIGRLEGPEVITDPAKFPKAFKEAPQLTELVKAGKLPLGPRPSAVLGLHRGQGRSEHR
jgi:hypothetical protein